MTIATATGPGLMASLKEATAELHRHAETRRLQKSLLSGSISPALYRRYLIELSAIHAVLEHALADWRTQRPELATVFDDRQRRAADLTADIHALGLRGQCTENACESATSARLELLHFIEAQSAHDVMALLGCLYVLEGSMNGNKFIARALAKAWQISDGHGLRYLDPYGDEQRAVWQIFRQAMDALDANEEEIEAAVRAACRTFQAIAAISDELLRGAAPTTDA